MSASTPGPAQGRLEALLRPRSIAVLGASDRPAARSRGLIATLAKFGYEGEVLPVNPKYERVGGHPCHPSIEALPLAPDAVAFCVGRGEVLPALEQAARRGARAAVVYESGFGELGGDGLALQTRMVDLCREAGMALCGPNCMGILSPAARSSLYKQEVRETAGLAGNVGLVSQSGSICIGLLTDVRRFGFSHVVSSGNEAVTTSAEYLDALIDDAATRVIALFAESVRDPERFVAALDRAADAGKPVVVLKVGRNERTQRAITSHTGGLAGSSRVFSALLRAHRAIEVSDLDELAEVLAACQARRWPTGRRLAVVTASGGQAELVLDVATQAGLELPPLPAEVRERIAEGIGGVPGDGNPLDAWGSGDFQANFRHAMHTLAASSACDAVVLCLDGADGQPIGNPARSLDFARVLAEAADAHPLPHYALSMRPGLVSKAQVDLLAANGIAFVGGARQGLAALDRLARWAQPAPSARAQVEMQRGDLAAALAAVPGRKTVNEYDAKNLLARAGLPVTRERRVATQAEALAAAEAIGYPVVLKGLSDDIAHKSEHGLVFVGLRDAASLTAAWDVLARNANAAASHGRVDACLVQEMIAGGIETFAGVKRDPDHGLVLAFGLGGIAVELLQDVVLRMLPLRAGEAAAMIEEIRGAALLQGARSRRPYDVPALVRCLESLADFAWTQREHLGEIDLNPIVVLPAGEGCRVVDALIVPQR